MNDPDSYISEEAAARIWKRAVELQAEAARRSEPAEEPGDQPENRDGAPGTGFALAHVRTAALEAGIDAEFVEAALADHRAEETSLADVGARSRRFASVLLRDPPSVVTARREVDASVDEVLAAMEHVLPRGPFELVLADRLGDPRQGGVLVFDIPNASFAPAQQEGFTLDASWADFREVRLSVRSVAEGRTEVRAESPVAWAWTLNAFFVPAAAVLSGAVGGLLGLAVAGVLAALVPEAARAIMGAVVMALGGGLGAWGGARGVQVMYRHSLGRGERALDGLLQAVGTRAQGGWGLVERDDPPGS